MLMKFIGNRISGFLFSSKNGLPLLPSNILRLSLHQLLENLGQTKSGARASWRRPHLRVARRHRQSPLRLRGSVLPAIRKFGRQHQQQEREQSAGPLRAQHLFEQLGYDQPRRRRPNAHSPETEERERFAAEALTRSPDLLKILEPLEVVFFFQPAFDSEFSQDRHHLSDGTPANSVALPSEASPFLYLSTASTDQRIGVLSFDQRRRRFPRHLQRFIFGLIREIRLCGRYFFDDIYWAN